MSVNPAKPPAGVPLCRLDDLADPGTRGFAFREGDMRFLGFLVRQGDQVRGYVDQCPHAGWPLSGVSDRYLTRDGRHLLCAAHGALFKPEDGECVSGPCFGDHLTVWPVEVEDGMVVTAASLSRDKPPPYWGGCLCGQVRYKVSAPALNVRACHCRACQKAASSPFLARAVFPKSAVDRSGKTLRYASSKRLERVSCSTCGTLVFGEPLDKPDLISVATMTLDEPEALAPTMHVWTSRKVSWLRLDDGLPQYPEGPPE